MFRDVSRPVRGLPERSSTRRSVLRDCEKFGIRYVTWHGLRHTHATLSLMAQVPLHVVSLNLGHANPGVTLDFYAGVLLRFTAEAAVKVDKHIFGGPEPA
ncbi:MAG: tyrosine-type recombinase/integrase [Acidimicrobiales bacterium]|nr:tyrosine-type recombinase/integrase [Acidimicrobiales bacterium]